MRLHQPMVRSQKPQLPTSPWPLALDTAAVPSICSLAPKPGAWAAGRRLHRLMGIDHIWLHQPTAAIVFVLLRDVRPPRPEAQARQAPPSKRGVIIVADTILFCCILPYLGDFGLDEDAARRSFPSLGADFDASASASQSGGVFLK